MAGRSELRTAADRTLMIEPKYSENSEEFVLPSTLNFLAPVIVDDLIRVGAENDGGYIVPEHLVREVGTLISLGVSEEWSFDEEFLKLNPAARVDAYDHSISGPVFRKRLLFGLIAACIGRRSFAEAARNLRVYKSYGEFFRGAARHYQQRVYNRNELPFDVTFAQIMERVDSSQVFLKMDIEGCEYRIVDDIVLFPHRIAGMTIEFHDTAPLRSVFKEAMDKLLKDYEVVHLHGNNDQGVGPDGLPEVLEVTLERKPLRNGGPRRTTLPLPLLDSPNHPARPDHPLRFCLESNRG
jgi:hypothetical protein